MTLARKDKDVAGSSAAGGALSSSPLGFRANLTASLGDLVQMECLARSTKVIRVVSGEQVGYLYFQRGEIVHAMSSSELGDAAALEILSWDQGSFEPCSAGWTSVPTITTPWQALMMRSVTARDEALRDQSIRDHAKDRTVVAFPRERSQATMPDKPPPSLSNVPRPDRAPATESPSTRQSSPSLGGRGIERAVRLAADGKIIASRGETEELAAMTAYATRLGALIGDRLGMERLTAMECIAGPTRRVFYVESSGNWIGLEGPADADLGALREKVGL